MQGEHFTIKLNKGPRGFGFSLVAAPAFSSDVSYTLYFTLTILKLLYSCRLNNNFQWVLTQKVLENYLYDHKHDHNIFYSKEVHNQ